MLRQNDLRWTQSGRRQFPSRVNRMRCLVLSLTAALVHSAQPAIAASTTWTVKTCDDSGMDSLRQIVGNASTQSGDIVDLGELPARCGVVDSTITLSNGEIVVNQDNLTLLGPKDGGGSVTIHGDGASRVLNHLGSGTLGLDSLRITHGINHVYGVSGNGFGGCINSEGSVYLFDSTVDDCDTAINTGPGGGGGIRASAVTLVLSRVSNSAEFVQGQKSCGGGVKADIFLAKYSSLSENFGNFGAGACADSMTIFGSSVYNNHGEGLYTSGSAVIDSSTLSGNDDLIGAGLTALDVGSVTISNSTIAFNNGGSGIYFVGATAASALTLRSSIVAKNNSDDIYIRPGYGVLDSSGTDNLVVASNVPSPPGVITVTSDPKLGPLQFNGGWTRTHATLPGSPAIGMGNNNAARTNDQRGTGYPRTTGPNANVDIGAFQFDSIFANGFGWAE